MATINGSQSAPVKSAMRTLDIVELVVARAGGVGAQEIASALSIPVSSLSYLLATLVERDYLRREGRQYFPGEGLDRLRVPRHEQSLVDRARPIVKSLRHQLNETTSLFMLVPGWKVEVVLSEAAVHTLRYSIEVGARAPMHCVAGGKAILAALPQPLLEEYFQQASLEPYTANTITDPEILRQEILRIRETGFAYTREEYTMGITAISIALPTHDTGYAAISVGAPSPRVGPDLEAQILECLKSTAKFFAAG